MKSQISRAKSCKKIHTPYLLNMACFDAANNKMKITDKDWRKDLLSMIKHGKKIGTIAVNGGRELFKGYPKAI